MVDETVPAPTRTADEIGTDIAYELEALADALLAECPPGFSAKNEDDYRARLNLRSKGTRIKALSLAVLTLFSEGDNADSVETAADEVYGVHPAGTAA